MNKIISIIIILISNFFISAKTANAIVNPLESPNNRFGIHVSDQNDIQTAAQLLNSSGGQWGYITIVIQETDRDLNKWQSIFDELREIKLIPIVRIATKVSNGNWELPRSGDLIPWVDFLNSLNWVVKNRYIILFNEPNHAKEWGGEVDPRFYAQITTLYANTLKQTNSDFFVMPGAIDLSASNTTNSMHPVDFYKLIFDEYPDYLQTFDGLANHSYPNPDFSSSPYNQGRNSINGFLWEQQFLKTYGLPDNFPIFITETGWAHNQSLSKKYSLSPQTVANYLKIAFESVFDDPNIVAVTPFIISYPAEPFSDFSWLDPLSSQPLEHFTAYQHLSKTVGQPIQVKDFIFQSRYFPQVIISESTISIALKLVNTGQNIWDSSNTQVIFTSPTLNASDKITVDPIPPTKPFDLAKIWLTLKAPEEIGSHQITVGLTSDGKSFGEESTFTFEVVKTTNISARIRLFLEKLIHPTDIIISYYENIIRKIHLA